jgi:hypothetical protein
MKIADLRSQFGAPESRRALPSGFQIPQPQGVQCMVYRIGHNEPRVQSPGFFGVSD